MSAHRADVEQTEFIDVSSTKEQKNTKLVKYVENNS